MEYCSQFTVGVPLLIVEMLMSLVWIQISHVVIILNNRILFFWQYKGRGHGYCWGPSHRAGTCLHGGAVSVSPRIQRTVLWGNQSEECTDCSVSTLTLVNVEDIWELLIHSPHSSPTHNKTNPPNPIFIPTTLQSPPKYSSMYFQSFQDCDAGYTRSGGGAYLGTCEPCRCNGHSGECDPDTGRCRVCTKTTVMHLRLVNE